MSWFQHLLVSFGKTQVLQKQSIKKYGSQIVKEEDTKVMQDVYKL